MLLILPSEWCLWTFDDSADGLDHALHSSNNHTFTSSASLHGMLAEPLPLLVRKTTVARTRVL